MSRPIKVIHNAETGEIIEREYTDQEMAQYEADQAATAKIIADRQAAKARREALLERLGLSEEEAVLLSQSF